MAVGRGHGHPRHHPAFLGSPGPSLCSWGSPSPPVAPTCALVQRRVHEGLQGSRLDLWSRSSAQRQRRAPRLRRNPGAHRRHFHHVPGVCRG